jgi:hypothetical protein
MPFQFPKIHLITDFHSRADGVAYEYWDLGGGFDPHWRWYAGSYTALNDAVDQANAEEADIFIICGDEVDLHAGVDASEALISSTRALQKNIGITNRFKGAGGVIRVIGNHDNNMFPNQDDYWSIVDISSTNAASRSNEHEEAGDVVAYTYDFMGVRFVVMYLIISSTDPSSQITWLTDTALDTSLPCIVLTHCPVTSRPTFIYTYQTLINIYAVPLRETFEAAGNVKFVFSGHFHRNGIAGYGAEEWVEKINGISYVKFRGSVLGANDGDSLNDNPSDADGSLEDSSHYAIRVLSDSVGKNIYDPSTGFSEGEYNFEIEGFLRGRTQGATRYGGFI